MKMNFFLTQLVSVINIKKILNWNLFSFHTYIIVSRFCLHFSALNLWRKIYDFDMTSSFNNSQKSTKDDKLCWMNFLTNNIRRTSKCKMNKNICDSQLLTILFLHFSFLIFKAYKKLFIIILLICNIKNMKERERKSFYASTCLLLAISLYFLPSLSSHNKSYFGDIAVNHSKSHLSFIKNISHKRIVMMFCYISRKMRMFFGCKESKFSHN